MAGADRPGHGRRRGVSPRGSTLQEPLRGRDRDRGHALEWPALLRSPIRQMSQPRLHCALYTRKSSEEGLEQAFNSLDAQREACAAYVKSQAGEGWRAVRAATTMAASPAHPWSARRSSGFSATSRPARSTSSSSTDRPPDPVVGRLRTHDRDLRSPPGQLRQRHPGLQHHDQHGPPDTERAVVLRPVRARGDGRAHPRQDCGLQGQGHVDGRHCAAWLRAA